MQYIFHDIENTWRSSHVDLPDAEALDTCDAQAQPVEIIDLADLLSPLLCEVASSIEGADHRDMLQELRRQRVVAYKDRLRQGAEAFPGFSWLSIDVSKHAFCMTQPQPDTALQSWPAACPLFQKDEATGECKQR